MCERWWSANAGRSICLLPAVALLRCPEMSGISWLIFLEFNGHISSDLQILRHFP